MSIQKFSPVTEEHLGDFHITTKEEVLEAAQRARKAAPGWAAIPLERRLKHLDKLRKLIIEEGEEIAREISKDTGKPIVDSLMTELMSVPLFLEYYQKEAPDILKTQKVKTPILFPGKSSYIQHYPMGVIAIISPWNFPFQLAMVPLLSALIAGNAVILKPSEVTPLTGMLMKNLMDRINLPKDVCQILMGDGSTGAALTEADVDKIFFTGSVATGKKVMAAAAKKPIPVELELGGKDAFIVCHDAPLERTVKGALWGGLINCGQMCVSVERIFVVESIYDTFVDKLKEEIQKLTIGAPEEQCDIGPMTFPSQIKVVEQHLADALEKGAKITHGGKKITNRPGLFFEPTIIEDVKPGMLIYDEETFGPVLPIIKVRNEHQALKMANDHQYGLTGSVWTSDHKRGLEIASKMECGQAMVNDVVLAVGNPALPFGGVKSSGFGRYHGKEGLLGFTHQKSIMVDRAILSDEPFWFPYAGKLPHMTKIFKSLLKGKMLGAVTELVKIRRKK